MSKHWTAIAAGVLMACVASGQLVFALSLEEAKSKGLVGEQSNGYLGVVQTADGEAQALARDINQKRRQAYIDIAKRNGTAVAAVEALAGEKAIQNSKSGHYVEGSGGWVKK